MIKKLSKKFTHLENIKTLKMNNNQITDNGVKYLLKAITRLKIECIYL